MIWIRYISIALGIAAGLPFLSVLAASLGCNDPFALALRIMVDEIESFGLGSWAILIGINFISFLLAACGVVSIAIRYGQQVWLAFAFISFMDSLLSVFFMKMFWEGRFCGEMSSTDSLVFAVLPFYACGLVLIFLGVWWIVCFASHGAADIE